MLSPGTIAAVFGLGALSSAQAPPEPPPAPFGQPIPVPGAMERFDQEFTDGLILDLFSPQNRTIIVNQNMTPLGGQFVSGTNGEGFVALQPYSYVIATSDVANDLIAKIEIPYNLDMLVSMGIQETNTYVGRLAADKTSWVVDETTRNVHRSENNTRIIKMTSLDGEFRLLARKEIDDANIFVQYGQGETRTVNVTVGGRQEAEFIDGLRFSLVAQRDVRINTDIRNGVPLEALPAGTQSLNSFAWVVNTSDPTAGVNAIMKVPFNRNMLMVLKPGDAQASALLTVAKRPLNSPGPFAVTPEIQKQVVNQAPDDTITIQDVPQLDGEYVIVVNNG